MNTQCLPEPMTDATLSELAALGMRAARVVVRMMEVEQAAVNVAAGYLPEPSAAPASLAEAAAAGRDVDAVAAAMAQIVPRVEILSRALDGLSRSVRRTVALMRRIEAGWPRAGRSDDRAAMVRRQVARGVAAVIRRESDDEVAERLFGELDERLEDIGADDAMLSMPVDTIVRDICRDLGLAAGALPDDVALEPGVKRTTVLLRGSGQSPVRPARRDSGAIDTG